MKYVVSLVLAVSSMSFGEAKISKTEKPKKVSESFDVAFVNELVGGKKTWVMVPSDKQFTKNQVVTAKVVNVLNEAHGFKIPGSVEPKVIMPTSSETISFKVTKPGTTEVQCHMHPAHVGTKFTVK